MRYYRDIMKSDAESKNSLNTLKRKNQRDVLEVVRRVSPISIADISDKTGLSKVTVTKSLEHYIDEGLILGVGKGDSTEDGGKRPNLFAFNPDRKLVFCVKMEDFQFLAGLTNLEGEIVASHTAFYDNRTSLEHVLKCIKDAFHLLIKRQKRMVEDCIGAVVGWPGVINPEKGICYTAPHFSSWGQGIPLRDMIEKLLPAGIPVHVDNWVHFHAYGELKSMQRRIDRFFVISSELEGINGSLMIDGKVYRGHGCLSSEIGHMIVDTRDDAEVCLCGGKGCFEAVVSPQRIVARVKTLLDNAKKSSLHKKEDESGIDFSDILDAANNDDELAKQVVEECAGRFAVGVNNIMQICDPELIIIQGEYAAAGDFFRERLLEKIETLSLPGLKKTTRIEYSKLGHEGAIIGAGNYVADGFFSNLEWV